MNEICSIRLLSKSFYIRIKPKFCSDFLVRRANPDTNTLSSFYTKSAGELVHLRYSRIRSVMNTIIFNRLNIVRALIGAQVDKSTFSTSAMLVSQALWLVFMSMNDKILQYFICLISGLMFQSLLEFFKRTEQNIRCTYGNAFIISKIHKWQKWMEETTTLSRVHSTFSF